MLEWMAKNAIKCVVLVNAILMFVFFDYVKRARRFVNGVSELSNLFNEA